MSESVVPPTTSSTASSARSSTRSSIHAPLALPITITDEDGQPLTSRTHDGVIGHQTTQPTTNSQFQPPPSPSQSAYTPSTTTAPTTTTVDSSSSAAQVQSQPQPSPPATSSSAFNQTLKKDDTATPNTQLSLAKTQPLTARPSTSVALVPSATSSSSTTRASSAVGTSRPRSRQELIPMEPSEASKLPFYEQRLKEPDPSVVQPLSHQHLQSLPLAAVLAHISKANAEALELMKYKEYQLAYEKLRRAESFCSAPALRHERGKAAISLRATTYNNIAILFKSVNQLRQALWYANRALRLEINFQSSDPNAPRPNPAGTHLNMCAILSSLGRHGSALLHAECALSSLYLELHQLAAQVQQQKRAAKQHQRSASMRSDNSDGQEPSAPPLPTSSTDRASILSLIAVAYHNMAVEQEFLHQFRASTHSYRRAHEFSQKRLGERHVMTKTIERAYEGAVNLHPLKVVAKTQSMNPHTKLTVSNTAATQKKFSNPHNKWLIPSLETNPMTARHIPVRYVPFNQFVSVTGLPVRETHSRSGSESSTHGGGVKLPPTGRPKSQQQPRRLEEEKEYQFQGGDDGYGGYDGQEEDDAFGPEVTEQTLRQRQFDQQRQLNGVTGFQTQPSSARGGGPMYPSHPPPAGVMNAEESGGVGVGADGHHSGLPEEAGYWSDPELSETPTPGGTVGRGRKTKLDPRHGRIPVHQGRFRPGSTQGALPISNSTGTLQEGPSGRFQLPFQPMQPFTQQQQQQLTQSYPQPYPTPPSNYGYTGYGYGTGQFVYPPQQSQMQPQPLYYPSHPAYYQPHPPPPPPSHAYQPVGYPSSR